MWWPCGSRTIELEYCWVGLPQVLLFYYHKAAALSLLEYDNCTVDFTSHGTPVTVAAGNYGLYAP